MPAIFNKENRDFYEKRLLETGLEIIKQKGLKGMRIEDITKKIGFAKTTFYTFFSSKEDFIYKIAIHKREKVKAALMELVHSSKKMNRTDAKNFFKTQFLSDANIYRYLSRDDYDYLKSRWPENYTLNPITDEKNSRWLLDMMDARPDCDWKLFSNYVKAIVTVTMHSENLYQDIYEETILLMIDGLVNYIFG